MTEPVASSTVISYARAQYDAEVLDLATRLRADGVPCALDRFEMRPPGGWSRWMTEKMTGTDIVLVVCSKAWYDRYHLNEMAVDSTLALACARLECIYLLLATRTVERVERLDLTRSSGGVDVAFGGIRARQYSNADPYTITVTGTCPLG